MTAPTPAFQFSSSTNFRLGLQPPNELDPAIKEAVAPLYAAIQQVFFEFVNNCGTDQRQASDWQALAQQTPTTTLISGNLRRFYVQASENIAFGALVNLFSNAGVLSARNANSSTGKQADGFCTTAAGITASGFGEVTLSTGVASVNGLIPGTRYYLSATSGLVQAAPDTTAGHLEQYIGIAITTSSLYVNMSPAAIQH